MQEQQTFNLIDCILRITNRAIAMKDNQYVYLDTKEPVEVQILEQATALKQELEAESKKTMKLTARQARLALMSISKLSLVETAINSLSSPQKEQALIEWEYATEILRGHPFVQNLASALNLSETEIDTLFIEGAKL